MKKTICILILILMLFIVGCNTQDITNQAIADFNEFESANDIALVEDNEIIYFNNYTIKLNNLIQNKGEILNGGYIVTKNKIYFSTSLEIYMFNFTFIIYQCDIDGKNLELIYEVKELKTNPKAITNDMKFYYEFYTKDALDEDSRQIDCYDIINEIHTTVATGRNCILSDYKAKNIYKYQVLLLDKPYFEFFKDKSYFEITNKETNEVKKINTSFLEKTIYYELMEKYQYSTKKIEVNENHIYITYTLETGNNDKHPFLIFEYDFESDTIEYKQLSLLEYGIQSKIIYLK